ncbi:3-methyladenine DNA glycosylase AlkD [Pseudonocardia thermophila]|uniref:3-methyladenine DNA glycosylase AlkD n=1 Tax=Pseudonocardia thermophila TaxID=1848 RepID=A0A1M6XUX9_PSETH|nr:DNA alkylation repair protein [Pseudonocardia thermophila]SHL09615.1 3-methyladenine DNA glycosylase AlkD [Pseudonocardia thermophila]
MTELAQLLRDGLAALAVPGDAPVMQAYMKSAMPFRGVKKPAREKLVREALAAHPVPDAAALAATVDALWDDAAYREERYLAIALIGQRRHLPWIGLDWLPRLRHWIVDGAWWDYVDELASKHVGRLLRAHPAELTPVVRGWATDPDRWLRRTAVICQLTAGADTDLGLLTHAIEANLTDPDFFLRKGIGWALRQYARTDPEWVRAFVAAHPGLSALSKKEALRRIGGAG